MQGLHHQQQQLAALLSAALPKDSSSSSAPSPPPSSSEDDDSSRIAAVTSLHRAILYPPNSLLVTHSASFLAQGFSQLLSDKSYLVRQEVARTYGALCAVLCSIPIASNGRQNHVILGTLVDRFINWALPLLKNSSAGDGPVELALESLHEFLNVGDMVAIERYALRILKACQELLEDERTSLVLLHRLLGVLTFISLKFFRCFQNHFVDIVDLLLGWAMVPDLAESDRRVIMDSFLQFQKHWMNNLQFSLGLLSKFLGDMDVLLQDGGSGTRQHCQRLLALLSCFSTVLQATASGLLEMNLLEQITEPLSRMLPPLLNCLSMLGKKFGWSKWIGESWRCLTLLAEILSERFSNFYPFAVDILFQSLEMDDKLAITSFQVHGVLKTNLQLLSLQKFGLLPSFVRKILQFDTPISQLRLHPNHLVTGSCTATYIFLLQHAKIEVVEEAMKILIEELQLLKGILGNTLCNPKSYLKSELHSLIKFDLKVLLTCVSLGGGTKLIGQSEIDALYSSRSMRLVSYIMEKLNPFDSPIQGNVELQVTVMNSIQRLTAIEFLSKCSIRRRMNEKDSLSFMIFEYLRKYTEVLVKALDRFSPLAVKLESLIWIHKFCENIVSMQESTNTAVLDAGNLLFAVLDAASDSESTVRSQVASVLEMLLRAKLIHQVHLYNVTEVALEKLGDPDEVIKDSFVRLLSHVLPVTVYVSDVYTYKTNSTYKSNIHWKQVFALKQLPHQLHSQQLVSILSYVSQRWKVPLSSWIQRLIHTCRKAQVEDTVNSNVTGLSLDTDEDILERVSSVNLLAGAWWAIHEAARYCITTRLRTNLGGPTQTFAALERMLLDIAHVLHLDTEQNDERNLNIAYSSNAHLLPLRLLLDFVEGLKKYVYNAYEGSTVLPSASRQSSLFFRANKKVCEEWFSRICEPMMNAGLALQCHDATIHYCSLRLHELKNLVSRAQLTESLHTVKSRFAGDISRVLRHLALSLCKNCEPEALIGLHKWAKLTFFPLFAEENHEPFSSITGLVYVAQGQYEKAAVHFDNLLQIDDSLGSMGSDGVQFAITRVIESYTAICDWKSLESWLSELQTLRAKHAGKTYSGALTVTGNEINAIHALARFDEGDFQAAWGSLDLTPKSSSELTLDPKLALQRSEQMLLQAMLLQIEGKVDKVSHEIHKAKTMMEEMISILPLDGLAESAPYANQLHCIFAFEESCKPKTGSNKELQSLLSLYINESRYPINQVHQDCDIWLKILRVYKTTMPNSSVTLKLCKNVSSLARKQGNFMLANRLNNYLQQNHVLNGSEGEIMSSSTHYERILLLHAENKVDDAFTNLWSFVQPFILNPLCVVPDAADNILKAKACLKISEWLKQDHLENVMQNILTQFNNGNLRPNQNRELIVEEVVGTTTKLSSLLCPNFGKSWLSYGSWCYNQARASLSGPNENLLQSCSFSPVLHEVLPGKLKLTEEEVIAVQDSVFRVLHANGDNHVVQQVVHIIESLSSAPGTENSCGESLSETLRSQLAKCLISANVDPEQSQQTKTQPLFDDLVEVFWSLRRRKVSLFGHAARAYINYLSCSSSKNLRSFSCDGKSKQKTVSYTLRATLYLLNMILNYGMELKDSLESELSRVPLLSWQEITPQLFARLSSHPERVVRKQLEGILVMLAKLCPRSIVYPTLVNVNAYEDEPSEELQHVLSCLKNLYPRLIQDVQLMIKELENVTVLWEELWLSTLQDLQTDVMRRVNLLKEEAKRIEDNSTLSRSEKNKINAAKYSAMMAPIVVALERRLASTSRKPETAHESWFHKEYTNQIKSAITNLKTPPSSAVTLADVWRPFDLIASSLASYQRRSSISLSEVAPQLALLSSSDVPMPGLTSEFEGGLTILSFSEQVVILSTKTKPKKIVIKGSDGGSYTYLLKGREDLRLDARIMQLLQAINGLLQSSPLTRGQSLGIRYYSVTPISGRAGLIQWVDNVISIYSVFKSWQTRVQLSQLSASDAGNAPPVPRPSDMFYGKIIPALKEKGIRRVISRRDWPHEVKRKVLLDLMKEAPKELLHEELWCASEGFRAFSSKLKRYSGSVAAMSIVGHILGLGDRHLDNILMDFVSGDIVHIDYNVCFDKGQRLKIPEIVPFRLTQTIEAALGITGVEGTFRMNCEAVLGVLRKNKDILLMLLEVFVWDPLVEWTRGDFHDDAAVVGEERKGMELAVSLSLFASRVQEIRVPLQEHHDLLLATLPAIESALERFTNILNQYEIVSAHFYHTDQEKSNLVMYENSAKSTVLESKSNSEKARLSFDSHVREFSNAKSIVAEKAQEAATWIEQNGKIVDALRSNSIPEVQGCIDLSGKEESLSLTAAVLVAGVPLTIVPEPTQAQCHDIDTDVSQYIAELDNSLSSAVTSLQTYSLALQRILPLNYLTTSPVHSWQQILQLSVNSISSDILSLTRRQATDLINKRSDILDSVKATYNDMCFKVEKYGEEIEKVEQECEELAISIGSETELRAKERLLSAFVKYMKLEEKKEKILTVLNIAVSSMYRDVKHKIFGILNHSSFGEFEEQVEKCVLVSGFVNELQQHIALDSDTNWASIFQSSLLSCKSLICQMTDAILPDVVRSVIAFNSEVMDAFGALSQIRGSIDTALDQLIEVELERSALLELEQNYFLKVGRITERQLALEEASVKGRDNLSWEEAEELASQEEACREQLGELHQTWNQKDIRTNSMIRKESSIKNALLSAEHHFNSLTSANLRSKPLLVDLVQPFSDLELLDKSLSSCEDSAGSSPTEMTNLTDLINSGCSVSEYIWKFSGLLRSHSFFIWKVCVIDSFLDSCIHNAASSADQNLGFDQFVNVVKKRLEIQLQQHIEQYLKQRVAPVLLARLEAQIECMKHFGFEEMVKDFGAVNRVKVMLDEYCNAHETVKAAKSAASLMKKQGNELKEALLKTSLDMIQMKWMHNMTLSPKNHTSKKFLASDDKLLPVVLNLDRSKLLENIESSVAKIKRSIENLQSCERNSVTAEGQLERAMGWACGDAIPPEFKEHLMRRRQLLWEARVKSSDVIKVCAAVLDFESSRDGVFRSDAMTWQHDYLSALTRLDVTYQSYTRSEQEWKLAQSNMEAASDGLFSVSNELCIASAKAKSTSGDLQSTLVAMKDCASEASLALAAFCRVTRSHTALTSECGSMLEEVLAITEGLHDVHSLGKEASALQSSLMEDLSKASSILVPLESVLSKDVTAMSDAMTREKETKMEISPIHGQAIYQSYNLRIKDAFQTFKPLLPSLTFSIKGLHSMLTRLARTANLHAGNLHKALEGLAESQEVRSQDTNLSRADFIGGNSTDNDDKESDDDDIIFSKSQNENGDYYFNVNKLSLQEKGWISPPDSVYSSSSADDILGPAEVIEHLSESEHGDVNNADSVLEDSDALESLNLGNAEVKLDDVAGLLPNKIDKEIHGTSLPNAGPANRVNRGKNAYALSVLRQVEMKLDGRDITDKREISVTEQVDNLLKQATSVDNLCNMYEGWTPWI